jgi:F-type H+-transporting ATPase subunit gamma
MANTTALKRRIGSVKNTRQITKAMELVAASKMRRAQEQAQGSRDFRVQAHDVLERLSGVSDVRRHPLFVRRKIKNHLIIVITSDTGLAGAYDANVLKQMTKELREDQDAGVKTQVITIGKKGAQFVSRLDVELLAAFPIFSTQPEAKDIRPIVSTLFDHYAEGKVDSVTIVYTDFISSIRQEVRSLELLPAQPPTDKKGDISPLEVAIFEPSIESIVDSVVARLIEVQVWQAILESLASEHSSRMMAMKNASDNASDIIDDLTLEFNTARQAAITQELAEIIGGSEALAS